MGKLGAAVHVSLGALESALRFVEDLAETGDPDGLGRRALPGLAGLIRADVLSYNEFGPEPGQVYYCAYPRTWSSARTASPRSRRTCRRTRWSITCSAPGTAARPR